MYKVRPWSGDSWFTTDNNLLTMGNNVKMTGEKNVKLTVMK